MNARPQRTAPSYRKWHPKRITVTFIVDVLAFVFFVLLVATGLLARYALPPGSGSLHGMGGGPSAGERPITLIWGLTRHEWGDLHFYVAVALMGVLALHLFQHWRWIAARVQGQSGRGSGWRAALGIVGLVAILSIAATPFLSPKEQVPRRELHERRSSAKSPTTPRDSRPHSYPNGGTGDE